MALNLIQSEIYFLLKRFVDRQRIAFDLLKTVRPDLISMSEGKISRPSKEYIKSTSLGDWGDNKEWTYLIHGRGCRLIHKETDERIEWNAPDLNRFDPYWFTNWVQWALSSKSKFVEIPTIRLRLEQNNENLTNLIFKTLDELKKSGEINYHKKTTNMYSLRKA
ncbi:hypothetical protein [Synechococcus sp. PCC 7336]|uniref:DUF6896 domain-containing protein n=1 Tax=Synechococcus sp. PCC 7336 TaxID=195250 RepID=UPI000363067F|nr:hypothetical protein [Synechococcus sp. PCC 7336]